MEVEGKKKAQPAGRAFCFLGPQGLKSFFQTRLRGPEGPRFHRGLSKERSPRRGLSRGRRRLGEDGGLADIDSGLAQELGDGVLLEA